MSYTPTLSPIPRPRVVNKQIKYSFTHTPTASPSPTPTRLLAKGQGYDFPYGAFLMILCLLYILSRINKKKLKNTDTHYTGIQMHQMYTLDPVRRRRI